MHRAKQSKAIGTVYAQWSGRAEIKVLLRKGIPLVDMKPKDRDLFLGRGHATPQFTVGADSMPRHPVQQCLFNLKGPCRRPWICG